MGDVIPLRRPAPAKPVAEPLVCRGVCRNVDHPDCLTLIFDRRPTDAEMRLAHDAVREALHYAALAAIPEEGDGA